MDKVFWLLPGQLAGRTGPDRDPWDPAALRSGGIGAVLSVNDGVCCYREDLAAADITYDCVPLTDNAPPLPGDADICLRALGAAFGFVQDRLAESRPTLVHCTSGKDRTGLFFCYYLVQTRGLSAADAITEVRHVRPIALSAPGWEDFAREVLQRVRG